jgi:hypothetical protein
MCQFTHNLSSYYLTQKTFRTNWEHLADIRVALLQSHKLRFIKEMLVFRLKGRNYVKRVAL